MNELGIDLNLDSDNMYIEESFTDMKVGTIRRLSPVLADGTPDKDRVPIFLGHTQLMSPNGPLPVSCEIAAGSLKEAIALFPAAIEKEVGRIIEQARNAQQQEQQQKQSDSGIIIPGR